MRILAGLDLQIQQKHKKATNLVCELVYSDILCWVLEGGSKSGIEEGAWVVQGSNDGRPKIKYKK